MLLDLTHYATRLRTLRRAWERYQAEGPDGEDAELYRPACIKDFELLVKIAGNLCPPQAVVLPASLGCFG